MNKAVYTALAALFQLLAWFLGGIGILGILMIAFPDSVALWPWYIGLACMGFAAGFQWLAFDSFKEASK